MRRRVWIYGAGEAGQQLLSQFLALPVNNYEILGFIDDADERAGSMYRGLPVVKPSDLDAGKVDRIVIAIPSLKLNDTERVMSNAQKLCKNVLVLPSVEQILDGKVKISHLSDFNVKSFVGGKSNYSFDDAILGIYAGSTILVSGGGGSIGSEIVKQLLGIPDCYVVVVEHSEYNLYKLGEELSDFLDQRLSLVLGNLADNELVETVFDNFDFDFVFHAAAYKHVPLIEANPIEGLFNNVIGTFNLIQASLKSDVSNFLLISTDKAVRPTNIMGVSKRICEQIVLHANTLKMRSNVVRFGNVMNSSGSVLPKFEKQIAAGGPVTVTHPEVTRYFMSIEQAVYLVLNTSSLADHRNLFVLDMGEPQKVLDLAVRLIKRHGCTPKFDKDLCKSQSDILIEFVGLRAGEKMYEELILGDELKQSGIKGVLVGNEPKGDFSSVRQLIEALLQNRYRANQRQKIRHLAMVACPEFMASDG